MELKEAIEILKVGQFRAREADALSCVIAHVEAVEEMLTEARQIRFQERQEYVVKFRHADKWWPEVDGDNARMSHDTYPTALEAYESLQATTEGKDATNM